MQHLPHAGIPRSHLRLALMHAEQDFCLGGAMIVKVVWQAVDGEGAEKLVGWCPCKLPQLAQFRPVSDKPGPTEYKNRRLIQ